MPMKLLLHLLIALSSMSLSSCIYSDLGRTIGSIGTEVPRIVPKAATAQKIEVYCGGSGFPIAGSSTGKMAAIT